MKKILVSNLKKTFLYLLGLIFCLQSSGQNPSSEMRDMTGIEIALEMAPGINLYNTLDATGTWVTGLATETMWGNPYTTNEMVASMANRGFKSLRIPVSWHDHMGPAPAYTIDNAWMDRVEVVVNYALNNGMYAIINIHHDDEMMIPTYEKKANSIDWVTKTWAQIAERFKDYGDYLLFETMNEPREQGSPQEWTGGSVEHRAVVNALNLAAVNTIRGSGGNNTERFIMVPQVGANVQSAIEDMIIPNNDTNIIVAVHAYTPYNFCLNEAGTDQWGSLAEIAEVQNMMKKMNEKFVSKGQAVVMGEWGASDKDNYSERVEHYDVYANACKEYGITPMIWMFNFNRQSLTWGTPLLEQAIIQAYNLTTVHVEDILLNIKSDTIYAGDTLRLKASILPEMASIQSIIWTSKNKQMAVVSKSGLVEGVSGGKVKITASTIGKSVECELFVIDTLTHIDFFYEAEDFDKESGTQAETCSDENGGQNIGYIENGDWCSYLLLIDSAGMYDFRARVATETNGGAIDVSVKNVSVGTSKVDGTQSDGWQDWYTTEAVEMALEKGIYEIKLTFKGAGGYLFNFNWFELKYQRSSTNTSLASSIKSDFQVYPNPATQYLNIVLSGQSSNIELYAMDGRLLMSTQTRDAKFTLDLSELNGGVYILKVETAGNCYSEKIILK